MLKEDLSADTQELSTDDEGEDWEPVPAPISEIDSAALLMHLIPQYSGIDKLIASAESRRIRTLREIERRRDDLAERLRKVSDEVIDKPAATLSSGASRKLELFVGDVTKTSVTSLTRVPPHHVSLRIEMEIKMTSEAKTAANRRNALGSTGPHTANGKKHSRGNALKHGFAACTMLDPSFETEVARVAAAFHSGGSDCADSEGITTSAQCSVTLARVRRAKMEVIAQASQQHLPTKPSDPVCAYDQYTKQLLRLDRYERRALSYRNRRMLANSTRQ